MAYHHLLITNQFGRKIKMTKLAKKKAPSFKLQSTSQKTFELQKSEILQIKTSLEDYRLENIQIEQFQQVETKKTVLEQLWKLLNNTAKPSEKLAILKAIEKTSDELPSAVNGIDSRDRYVARILKERNGQDSRLE